MKNVMSLFVLGVMVFAGCAAATISSDYNKDVDFSKLKTYSWSSDQPLSGDMKFDDPSLRETIRRSVEAELQAKGLQKSGAGQPDMLLKYYITVEQKKQVVGGFNSPPTFDSHGRWMGNSGPNNYAGMEAMTFRYSDGTFVLDMLNPASGDILWRGTLQAMVDPRGTPEKRKERAPAAIAKVLAKFPPSVSAVRPIHS
jgi:hypothetical protein